MSGRGFGLGCPQLRTSISSLLENQKIAAKDFYTLVSDPGPPSGMMQRWLYTDTGGLAVGYGDGFFGDQGRA